MNSLMINNVKITTDDESRYSLNDLHKAAGGNQKHKPSQFLKLDSVIAVAGILSGSDNHFKPISKIRGRYNGGTWVCKELVYKYAMWINPEFEVKVIQTFDSIINSINAPATMEALNELTLKIESDKAVASHCGKALAHYKKVKKENQDKWVASVKTAQLSLGFEG